MSPSSRAGGDFANTTRPPPLHPPFSPILACHTFDLAAGGLRNPRSSGAAQPLALFWCKARRLVVKSSWCPSAYALDPRPAAPRLTSPRLVFPLAPCALPIYLLHARAVCCPPDLTSLACPGEPLRKGAPPGQCRQVCCDTRILMLVCPASAESLSQTDPCAWRTVALASR